MISDSKKGYSLLGKEGVLAALSGVPTLFYQTGYRYILVGDKSFDYPDLITLEPEYIFLTENTPETEKLLLSLGFIVRSGDAKNNNFFKEFNRFLSTYNIFTFENSIKVMLLSKRDLERLLVIQNVVRDHYDNINSKLDNGNFLDSEEAKALDITKFYVVFPSLIVSLYKLGDIINKTKHNVSEYW